jgi:signal transduction histidine kinase
MRLPDSLTMRIALALAIGLLITQAVSFTMVLQSRERVREAQQDVVIDRLVGALERQELLVRWIDGGRMGRGIRRPGAATITDEPLAPRYRPLPDVTRRVRATLEEAGVGPDSALASALTLPSRHGPPRQAMVLSVQLDDGRWLNFTSPLPREDPLRIGPLVVQTLITYVVLLAALILVVRQLSRPLARLTDAARHEMTPNAAAPLPVEGPRDIRELTEAFEAMRVRIRRLFEEKDVMLGALGHDLRTPLTSLRLRVEQVEDEALRDAMARTVEDMAALLEDVLSLARRSHDGEPVAVDAPELAREAVAVFPDPGRVTLEVDEMVGLHGYPILLRRALRNLIDNALRYAGAATVRIHREDGETLIDVLDEGPGIPEADLDRVREAFVRGDTSRNRGTGGTGLGLAIADGVARSHGGTLELTRREPRGLRATLRLPARPGPSVL